MNMVVIDIIIAFICGIVIGVTGFALIEEFKK